MASFVPHERTLRKITVWTFVPAFTLIVASGCMASKASDWYSRPLRPTIIFFGLIPSIISAITSVLSLNSKHDPLRKRPYWTAGLWFIIDALLAIANFAVLMPIWMFEPDFLYNHADYMMLETYATVFLFSDMFIHTYLAFHYPIKTVMKAISEAQIIGWTQTECPHCHKNLKATETVGPKQAEPIFPRGENYLDEPEEGEASTGVIRLPIDSEA
ncbi:hypothetical protein GRF29_44g755037 [Pseudopithomyces chartarum]|uniref:Uncharacterized protein n=1 Tax=Pseudopithomyces chartarum TaxID=1892770 RepID=A0AAN6M0V6_9PLEO|nr:hypothetical protein GRF29_44g755037 [Pseudopithomyces chartarum]